jgi:hypothetical protein
VVDILAGVSEPQSIALDLAADKLYWSEPSFIRRSDLDGRNAEDLVIGGWGWAQIVRIALDLTAGKLYWSEPLGTGGESRIRRSNLDGSSIETLVTATPPGSIRALVLDPTRGKLYWSDSRTGTHRANLDGTSPESVAGVARALALDSAAQKLYWTGNSTTIQRADLDGSNAETFLTLPAATRMGLALDPTAGRLYWTEYVASGGGGPSGSIRRADLDGAGVENVVTVGLMTPIAIALDTRPPVPSLEPRSLLALGGLLAGIAAILLNARHAPKRGSP